MEELANTRIVGVHLTQQARVLAPRTGFDVALEALNGALDDAGMTLDEIDGIGSMVSGGPDSAAAWAFQLDTTFNWGGSISIESVLEASRLISAGRLNAVAFVFSGVRPTNTAVAPWTASHSQWTGWVGSLPDQPVQFGLVASRYIHEYGPRAYEAMAEAAASTRNYGTINPDAVYFARGEFDVDTIMASRFVAEPLTMFMCSSVTDGGAAMILTNKARAADTPKRSVAPVSGASLIHYPAYNEPPTLDDYYELGQHFRDTLKETGIEHKDIDVVEFYDHFASHYLLQFEQFGFCGKGEAADFVKSGAMKLDGDFPTCTDGGNLSFSHPGYPIQLRFIEAVRQIRGEAKDLCPGWETGDHTYDPKQCRMVKDVDMAFVSGPGTPTIQGSFAVLRGD